MAAELPAITSSAYASNTMAADQFFAVGTAVPMEARLAAARGIAPAPMVKQIMEKMMTRRYVQVFIVDTEENLSLEQCVLYKGDPKITDLTDQELFFELDIRSILEAHNAVRTKVVDKSVKDRAEYLEPARIRDLKMTVVTIASF